MVEVAVGKRIRITKIQQQMMLAVLGASLVLGAALVFSIFFMKYIIFNTTVIKEKDTAIGNYCRAIKNVGICKTKNKDGKFSDADLKKCNPEAIDVEEIPGTLRYNVLVNMTKNNNLESVARDNQLESCYDKDGAKRDFRKLYEEAESEEERSANLKMIKLCSSLRVIPDALPATQNREALLSSVNHIFNMSGVTPKALAPNRSSEVSPINGIEVIPVSVSYEGDVFQTTKLLQNFEKSIRAFSFRNATITYKSADKSGYSLMAKPTDKLQLSAQAQAFYTNEIRASETTNTIYASKEAKTATGKTNTKSEKKTEKK